MAVEKQVAMIFAGTRNLLREVPVKKVKEYQDAYLAALEASHQDILDRIRKGEYSDEITGVLEKVAKGVAKTFATEA